MRFSSEVNGYPVLDANVVERQRLDIYKRQNSEFNRLQSNRIDYNSYNGFNDETPDQSAEIINQAESRRFGLRRRPCVPVYPNNGKRHRGRERNDGQSNRLNDGRTLYDLNLYFLGYQPHQYQVNPASQTVSAIAAVDNNRPVSDTNYDHYGGYYDCEPNPFFRPPFGFGGGSQGAQYDDPNRPSYLGLVGQGLFDFFNGLFGYGNPNAGGVSNAGSGGYDTPVSSGAGTILNDNNDRPVYEINVPDTIAALVK